ncbi:hypothetical protein [Sphaerisporangium fuscum]|uniref:hypothetical protein n=1 Tax=Sphaerisporangium fuscum TaxID=2835868 RepID=UPI001BDCD1A1|nr:hypothetical protein [Sphaerisporangium fuscum]
MTESSGSERRVRKITSLEEASVQLTDDHHLAVEFRIQDLVRRLAPDGDLVSSCGGCNGCSGCSM